KAAAGQLVASGSSLIFFKGVVQAMLTSKWKLAVGAVLAGVALMAVGIGFRPGDAPVAAQAPPAAKPASELDALRKENELLKLNLQVVLEKVRSQEEELRALRGRKGEGPSWGGMPQPGMAPGAPMGGSGMGLPLPGVSAGGPTGNANMALPG